LVKVIDSKHSLIIEISDEEGSSLYKLLCELQTECQCGITLTNRLDMCNCLLDLRNTLKTYYDDGKPF
jgi:hypothetical protein